MHCLLGMEGMFWASPVTDVVSVFLALFFMLFPAMQKHRARKQHGASNPI